MTKMKRKRNAGSTLVEVTLVAPWLLFLLVALFDVGMYSYALISVENSARIAAEYTSRSPFKAADRYGACVKVRAELANLPGIGGLSNCDAAPLRVDASSVTGPDGAAATSVTVTYRGISLIPIPRLMTGTLAFTRNIKMRVQV
jgi:Flp pilus assembly protein TadG